VPSFTKPGSQLDFYKMFNARSESAGEKPVFSRLLSSHRCVVLLEGFYEWKADAGGWVGGWVGGRGSKSEVVWSSVREVVSERHAVCGEMCGGAWGGEGCCWGPGKAPGKADCRNRWGGRVW